MKLRILSIIFCIILPTASSQADATPYQLISILENPKLLPIAIPKESFLESANDFLV